jgi:hypothetical protein
LSLTTTTAQVAHTTERLSLVTKRVALMTKRVALAISRSLRQQNGSLSLLNATSQER